MEKGRKRPPAALKLGGIPVEHSWNVLLRAESSEPISVRHVATGGGYTAEGTFHYNTTVWVFKANEIPVRKRDYGADFSRYFCEYILH